MARTLIRNAYVVTMDERGSIDGGDVLIEDDRIAEVGTGLTADGVDVIDATGHLVMPGFVDGHRHMYGGLLRGGGADSRYDAYFDDIVKGFGGAFTPEDTHAAVRLGALESIDSGITTLHAWEHNLLSPDHATASAQALLESGLRGRFSYGPPNDTMVVDLDDVPRLRDELLADERLLQLGIATRGVELDQPEIWRPEIEFAREQGLPVTAHVMEGQLAKLLDARVLGPDFLAIHVLGATEDELRALVDTGAAVCIAPPALARASEPLSPIGALLAAGATVSLSIDSTAGCDTSDMFAAMRISVLLARSHELAVDAYRPAQALRHATIDGARALGLGDVTGSLTPGKQADLIVVDLQALNMAPANVPETQIVLCGQPRNVEHVFVAGRCLKRDGELVGADVAGCVEAATRAIRGIEKRVGKRVV